MAFSGITKMKWTLSVRGLLALALVVALAQNSVAQTEVITVQGNLPRYNYRDGVGNLLWALPANNTLWKIDGPFNAGVFVCTAAAKSNSIVLNEGGVSIAGSGFPTAPLHVGTLTSPTKPGEVRFDPGNPTADAAIVAVAENFHAFIKLETRSSNRRAGIRMAGPDNTFSNYVGWAYIIRDENNAANPVLIYPGSQNNNALVIRDGNIGLRVVSPTYPLQLANGAKCTPGGVWTNASSRELKEEIRPLDATAAKEALTHLDPVTFRYKAEPDEEQVGFIAEDVPDLVASKTRKDLSSMDVVAVLTKVVKDQQSQLDAQAEQLRKQAEILESQQQQLEQLISGRK